MNDPLERLLRDDARRQVPDDGFTARVLGALPARRPRPMPWLKPLLVLGSAALGCVLAVLLSPAAASLLEGFQDMVQLKLTPAAVSGLAMSLALLGSAIVYAAFEAD